MRSVWATRPVLITDAESNSAPNQGSVKRFPFGIHDDSSRVLVAEAASGLAGDIKTTFARLRTSVGIDIHVNRT